MATPGFLFFKIKRAFFPSSQVKMGCLSSKMMTRSLSYQHEMKWGSQGTVRGAPALTEDMLIPRKASSHFLALVCSATTMTDKRQSGSFRFESPISASEAEDGDASIKCHSIPENDKDQGSYNHVELADPCKQSTSWHSLPLEEMRHAETENCTAGYGTLEVNGKCSIQSQSFRTVEEYDRLLERIWQTSMSYKENRVEESDENEVGVSASLVYAPNQTKENTVALETSQPSQGDVSLVGQSNASSEDVTEFPDKSTPPDTRNNDRKEPSSPEIDIQVEPCIKEDAPRETTPPLMVKGFKRKSMARGLDTLKIPSTFELPAVASLREWHPGGQVFSPDSDPTPKFGSYRVPTDNSANKPGENAIFTDEVVIALEEQLQHLKAEEAILKQITSTWEVSGSTGVKKEIAISTHSLIHFLHISPLTANSQPSKSF